MNKLRQVRRVSALTFALLSMVALGQAQAMPYEEEIDDGFHPSIAVVDVFLVPARQGIEPRIPAADIEFAKNMGRHHQGAVEMASTYLNDPRGRNPVLRKLAHSIIENQKFEIAYLDGIRRHVEAGPKPIAKLGDREIVLLDRGVDGLEHLWRYRKAPPPDIVDIWFTPAFVVSEFDVQFARPMIAHHSAAIRMAEAYNADRMSENQIIRQLNLDLVIDQNYEIGFLRDLMRRYEGDPGRVPDDPRMMAIMKASMSGMDGKGGMHQSH